MAAAQVSLGLGLGLKFWEGTQNQAQTTHTALLTGLRQITRKQQ